MARVPQGAARLREDRDPGGPQGRRRRRGRRPALTEPLTLERLRQERTLHGAEAQARLREFERFAAAGDEAIFKELCFCILAANSSAEMGIKTLAAIDDLVWTAPLSAMLPRLEGRGFRFWRLRPAYIVATREHLRALCGLKLRDWLLSLPDEERRDRLASDKGFKGLGYKEAGHFLRNVGFKGNAILDKHILNCLRELGVIGPRMRPSNPRRYHLIERRMKAFASKEGFDFDELDLLLWRYKTGKILK